MKAICPICPHHCALEPGQKGICRARANVDGAVSCTNYGKLTAIALDPIEKKPLRRFCPGSYILSVGSYGCNLRCPFCQNSDISMKGEEARTVTISPEELVDEAKALAEKEPGNLGVAFTYNEPLISYEYVRDCAFLLRKAGLKTVLVTNGMICEEPLAELLPLVDAMNIDLKAFTQKYYDWLGGDLETVKRAIELSAAQCHVEVTTLIVPGENDSESGMEAEAAWLASIDCEIPLHISRFFPRYNVLDKGPTPEEKIHRLCEIARKHLRYVYPGNC
ncbi:MAG: AmmeMemoRadiSam system radical SAM enzyme [Clostridia bacterium]|nr:AmmeMemoRadiSam system radical SAM enzyme [Clostridia bacterium]